VEGAGEAAEAVGQPRVTVAVVSWNTRELLLRCLASLHEDARAGRARVVVIDNNSADGSAAAAREHAPWAEVIALDANPGFGAAVNRVARTARTPWLLAANADVALRPGALAALLAAGGDARVGAVAPTLVLGTGAVQQSVGPLPSPVQALEFASGIHRVLPALGDRRCLDGYWDPGRARDVPWAVGALLLVRRSAFDAVGGFDERQWMYAEDLDLGWRLHQAGWRTRYTPAAVADHASGAATAIAFGAGRRRRFMRETYLVIARRRGGGVARTTAAINVAGAGVRLAWMVPAAVVVPARRPAVRDTYGWLRAHLEGVRPWRAAP
jgi:N-acetylglucosaminyl-diphospho-decaprenol L-rhamnosyltransferase